MVGPAPEVMGGISAVVQSYLASDLVKNVELVYLNTHVDGSRWTKLLTGIKACLKFPALCHSHKPDIVHIHLSSYFSFYRKSAIFLLAKFFGKKVIVHCHGSNFKEFHDSSSVHSFFIRRMFNACTAILVLSKDWKETIETYTTNKRVIILYNPVISKSFNGSRPHVESLRAGRILFMGRVGERKGAYDILEAVPEVIRSYPDARFILAGDGDLEKAKRISAEKGIDRNVEFPGWVKGDDKRAYFRNSDIYLLPSYHEGIPVSILEAMAAGLPVISTPVGGIPDAIEDGVNGFLVNPGDARAIAEKLVYLLEHPRERKEMGTRNRTKVTDQFDIGGIISQLVSVYETTSPQ
jgi:glycosyltransferase involved in cell wall biosynthesis